MPAWFAVHLLFMVALHFAVPLVQWNLGMSRWWGAPIAAVGFTLVCVAAWRFAPVTTLRPDEEPSVLVTDGLHRWSRNPMYLGMLLGMVGGFVMLGSLSPVVALPVFVAFVDTRYVEHEERALEERFGDAYRAYKQRVPRWL